MVALFLVRQLVSVTIFRIYCPMVTEYCFSLEIDLFGCDLPFVSFCLFSRRFFLFFCGCFTLRFKSHQDNQCHAITNNGSLENQTLKIEKKVNDCGKSSSQNIQISFHFAKRKLAGLMMEPNGFTWALDIGLRHFSDNCFRILPKYPEPDFN